MKCKVCGVDKLSKEFTYKNLSVKCLHPPIHCLKCVIDKLSRNDCCPYLECGEHVANVEQVVSECENELEYLYPSAGVEDQNCFGEQEFIKVVMLTGDSETFAFDSSTTVEGLKAQLAKRFNVNPANQQLMYEECILQDTKEGRLSHLNDYNIPPFSTIHLLVLMYAIPKNCNHVTFDLSWSFPEDGCDALDASCFVFSGKSCLGIVDYCETDYGKKSVWHSGDDMDSVKKTGRHTIDAKLKAIPSSVTHLFFTLSAWNSPTLARYRDPCLKFFEASNRTSDLCQTTFSHALDSPAVIMCSVERIGEEWKIFQCGQMSGGNAKDYEPLKSSIQKLIKSDDISGEDTSRPDASTNEIDLAFAMDCTMSMDTYIRQAQQNIKAIAEEIGRHKVNLRFALIEYRDHESPNTSVTQVLNFTNSLSAMKSRLDACRTHNGVDYPEAVTDALHELLNLSWRASATKICVFISDAPPHGLGGSGGDHFPNGCPCGYDPMLTTTQLAAKGIVIYMVGCEPSILSWKDWFMAVAHITGGQYVPLTSAQMLSSVIVGGAMEEISLQKLLEIVTFEVQKLATCANGSVNQQEFEEKIFQKVKGLKTKKLAAGAVELPKPSAKALELAQKRSLAEVRKVYQPGSSYANLWALSGFSATASFNAVEGDVTRSQVSRMVQRVLMTTGLKAKCAPLNKATVY